MKTELPAERLNRRLGAATPTGEAANTETVDHSDDQNSLVPRWLPDANADDGPIRKWLAGARADPGRAGAVGLSAVAAIAVLVTVFTLIRDDAEPVVSAKLPPVQMASDAMPSTRAGPVSPGPAPEQPVVVSVVGLVNQPGLVTLTPGARVADALTAAGGVLGGADTSGLNMARHLADGEQVVVGIVPVTGRPPALGSSINAATPDPETGSAAKSSRGSSAPIAPEGPVDLNSATADELDVLPGIGPVTAEAIVSWRDQHGGFSSVDQLADVDGIGPARLDKLRGLVRV